MCRLVRTLSVLALAVLLPSAAYAQASIAGAVRDASGAVLPGVSVEAASPALIEKSRTVVTDGAGQYRIIDLGPGTYSVTFTLVGFATVKREGIILEGTFGATLNADMRVGALEETITVTGATPIVDIQSVRKEQVIDSDAIRDLPTARHAANIAALVPAVNTPSTNQNVGGVGMMRTVTYAAHGGQTQDTRLMIDGLSQASLTGGTFDTEHIANTSVAQEIAIVSSGGLGEAETAGVIVNLIPKDGGNTVRGSFFGNFANGAMQGSNITDELRASVQGQNSLKKVWEFAPTIGGPLVQNKLWYLFNYRNVGTRRTVINLWYNKNANNPAPNAIYVPDLTGPAPVQDETVKDGAGRITWQPTSRNKINFFWDEQLKLDGFLGVQANQGIRAPDGDLQVATPINRISQVSWTSPYTNRLLFEAGVGNHMLRVHHLNPPGMNPNLISVTEQGGFLPGMVYRGNSEVNGTYPNTEWRGAVSYVTGTHSLKVGFQQTYFHTDSYSIYPQGIMYRFNNGIPNQLTLRSSNTDSNSQALYTSAYAQDSWVMRKLTLQGGVRFDRVTEHFPSVPIGFSRYFPNGFFTQEADGLKWSDVTPRMAVAYDVTGDGKTAIKVTLGKYMGDIGTSAFANMRPGARTPTSVTRSWNDANGNYVPDCVLLNPVANGECGAYSVSTYGQNVYTNSFDPNGAEGWGKRPYNWEFSASFQRELISGVGLSVGYFRRWYGNFAVTDNTAVAVSDFSTFSVPVPNDPRLPLAGQTLTGLYDVSPAKFGLTQNYITLASNYGTQIQRWNGFDISVRARAFKGLSVNGGISTGRTTQDTCDLRANLPELSPTNPFCATQDPFLTNIKGLATYTIPRLDVLVSGTLQSNPGIALAATSNVPNAQVVPSLGRSLSGGAANVAINMAKPGTVFGDRINEVDLRLAKVLIFGRKRFSPGVDFYNLMNAHPVTGYNTTFGPTWPLPTQIMPARFLKLSVELDF